MNEHYQPQNKEQGDEPEEPTEFDFSIYNTSDEESPSEQPEEFDFSIYQNTDDPLAAERWESRLRSLDKADQEMAYHELAAIISSSLDKRKLRVRSDLSPTQIFSLIAGIPRRTEPRDLDRPE